MGWGVGMNKMQERGGRILRDSLEAADLTVNGFGDSMLGLNNGGRSQRIHYQPKWFIIFILVFHCARIQLCIQASVFTTELYPLPGTVSYIM